MKLLKHIIISIILFSNFLITNGQNDSLLNVKETKIYFYRKRQSIAEGGGIGEILINKNPLNNLHNGSRLIVELKDLNSIVQIEGNNKFIAYTQESILRFKPQPGNDYYVEVDMHNGLSFFLKDEKTGKYEFNYRLYFSDNKKPIERVTVSAEINETNEYEIQPLDTLSFRYKVKLDWEDFKMTPNPKDLNKQYHLNLTIFAYVKEINRLTGFMKVGCTAGIGRDLSWVKPEYKNSTLLSYLQLKYDIANYYAKRADEEINSKKVYAGNLKGLQAIVDKNITKMKDTFVKMDMESNDGTNENLISDWKNNINVLLE